MSNYGDLQDLIADDINRTDLTDQIRNEIKRAISHYSMYRFGFNETARIVLTTASQAYVSASLSDVIALDDLFITIGSRDVRMTPRPLSEVVECRPTSNGTPFDYAWHQNRIELEIPASDAFSLTAYIHYELPELSDDTDQDGWTSQGQDLIRARAEKILYANVLKDKEKAATAAALEKESLSALRTKNNRKLSGVRRCYL